MEFKIGDFIEFKNPINGMQKMGGYFKKQNGVKVWYPERLMVASSDGIYEIIPRDLTVPVLPQRPKKPRKKTR